MWHPAFPLGPRIALTAGQPALAAATATSTFCYHQSQQHYQAMAGSSLGIELVRSNAKWNVSKYSRFCVLFSCQIFDGQWRMREERMCVCACLLGGTNMTEKHTTKPTDRHFGTVSTDNALPCTNAAKMQHRLQGKVQNGGGASASTAKGYRRIDVCVQCVSCLSTGAPFACPVLHLCYVKSSKNCFSK